MKYFIQVRKDVNERGTMDLGKFKRSEKDWLNKEEIYDTLDQAVMEAKSCVQRNIHKAENIRVSAIVAEFETQIVVDVSEEVPPS